MSKKELRKAIQESIEHYRHTQRGDTDGFSTICIDCWNKEALAISSWLTSHLRSFDC